MKNSTRLSALVVMSALTTLFGCTSAETAPAPGANESTRPTWTADELQQRAGRDPKPFILDVRTQEEYAEGHVAGSVLIPYDVLEKRITEIEAHKDNSVVVYCRSGRRAGVAESILREKGFTKVFHLEGDMNGWIKDGRPLEK